MKIRLIGTAVLGDDLRDPDHPQTIARFVDRPDAQVTRTDGQSACSSRGRRDARQDLEHEHELRTFAGARAHLTRQDLQDMIQLAP